MADRARCDGAPRGAAALVRLTIAAVGRMKPGPELSLVQGYLKRADATGRALGLGPVDLVEIDERKARDPEGQSKLLLAAVPKAATAVALDERGALLASPEFAAMIARARDEGCLRMVFLIGGADGLTEAARAGAGRLLSFGSMVWPHMLVRVMLAEQICRAASILAGGPYHRA